MTRIGSKRPSRCCIRCRKWRWPANFWHRRIISMATRTPVPAADDTCVEKFWDPPMRPVSASLSLISQLVENHGRYTHSFPRFWGVLKCFPPCFLSYSTFVRPFFRNSHCCSTLTIRSNGIIKSTTEAGSRKPWKLIGNIIGESSRLST